MSTFNNCSPVCSLSTKTKHAGLHLDLHSQGQGRVYLGALGAGGGGGLGVCVGRLLSWKHTHVENQDYQEHYFWNIYILMWRFNHQEIHRMETLLSN